MGAWVVTDFLVVETEGWVVPVRATPPRVDAGAAADVEHARDRVALVGLELYELDRRPQRGKVHGERRLVHLAAQGRFEPGVAVVIGILVAGQVLRIDASEGRIIVLTLRA